MLVGVSGLPSRQEPKCQTGLISRSAAPWCLDAASEGVALGWRRLAGGHLGGAGEQAPARVEGLPGLPRRRTAHGAARGGGSAGFRCGLFASLAARRTGMPQLPRRSGEGRLSAPREAEAGGLRFVPPRRADQV